MLENSTDYWGIGIFVMPLIQYDTFCFIYIICQILQSMQEMRRYVRKWLIFLKNLQALEGELSQKKI